MTGRINKPIAFVLTGVVCMLFSTTSASAEWVTFWKTNECPQIAGLGVNAELGGVIQAAMALGVPPEANPISVGGVFCDIALADDSTEPFPDGHKAFSVLNADVVMHGGDAPHPNAIPGDVWTCVQCNYSKPDGAFPALSALGTAVLIGGLLTAGIYEIRRRQRKVVAA